MFDELNAHYIEEQERFIIIMIINETVFGSYCN
jgi:hypothetical protein